MDFLELLIGRRPDIKSGNQQSGRRITTAPEGVDWMEVRARTKAGPVHTKLARRNGVLKTKHGPMPYAAGRHYLIDYGHGERAVARRDIFERIYVNAQGDLYEKRPDITYRYFTLPDDVTVVTPEGEETAKAGDWIMQGVAGELYPIKPDHARELYERVDA